MSRRKSVVTIIDDNRFFYWGWKNVNDTWTNTIIGYYGIYLVIDGKIYRVKFKKIVPYEEIDSKCIMTKYTFYNRVYECEGEVLDIIEKNAESKEYLQPEFTSLYSLITK